VLCVSVCERQGLVGAYFVFGRGVGRCVCVGVHSRLLCPCHVLSAFARGVALRARWMHAVHFGMLLHGCGLVVCVFVYVCCVCVCL
jgi:hypothetical protein